MGDLVQFEMGSFQLCCSEFRTYRVKAMEEST